MEYAEPYTMNMTFKTDRIELIARSILRHLKQNPGAGDTLEGIVDWWLEYEKVQTAVNEVADALESLVELGALREISTVSGRRVYRLKD